MQRILVDRARAWRAEKRCTGWQCVTLTGDKTPAGARDVDVLALDDCRDGLTAWRCRCL